MEPLWLSKPKLLSRHIQKKFASRWSRVMELPGCSSISWDKHECSEIVQGVLWMGRIIPQAVKMTTSWEIWTLRSFNSASSTTVVPINQAFSSKRAGGPGLIRLYHLATYGISYKKRILFHSLVRRGYLWDQFEFVEEKMSCSWKIKY